MLADHRVTDHTFRNVASHTTLPSRISSIPGILDSCSLAGTPTRSKQGTSFGYVRAHLRRMSHASNPCLTLSTSEPEPWDVHGSIIVVNIQLYDPWFDRCGSVLLWWHAEYVLSTAIVMPGHVAGSCTTSTRCRSGWPPTWMNGCPGLHHRSEQHTASSIRTSVASAEGARTRQWHHLLRWCGMLGKGHQCNLALQYAGRYRGWARLLLDGSAGYAQHVTLGNHASSQTLRFKHAPGFTSPDI